MIKLIFAILLTLPTFSYAVMGMHHVSPRYKNYGGSSSGDDILFYTIMALAVVFLTIFIVGKIKEKKKKRKQNWKL